MKRIVLPIGLGFIIASASYAQCVVCNSLTEALKKPELVKQIKINGYRDGIVLDTLPAAIGSLVNLEIFYFSDQDFKTIPAAIGNLKNLKELSFAGCKLEKLPDEIFTLVGLKELILRDNMFTEKYTEEIKARFAKLMPATKVFL